VGELGPVREEPARLRPSSSLRFQAADVVAVERRAEGAPAWRLTTAVLGLYGAGTPLPLFYAEDIARAEMTEDDDPVRLFLDVSNHRLLSLLYRAWSKYRWGFTFEAGARDRTSQRLLGLIGLATPGLQEALSVPAGRLLRYAGTISMRPRGAAAVAGVVSDFFGGVPARIEQCVARWARIAVDDQNRLGARNAGLGQDLTVGEQVPDRAGKCRVEVGPLDFRTFEAFLPEGAAAHELSELAHFLLPDPLAYDVRLVLRGPEVPWLRLASGPDAARLGWTSWLRHDPRCPDKGELFPAPAAARRA
jgi:type VI secretion system protein ImpH